MDKSVAADNLPVVTEDEYWASVEEQLETAAANYQPKNRPWSQREIDLVTRFYLRVPIEELARKLGRSISAVRDAYRRYREQTT